jgi:hypothetical protein
MLEIDGPERRFSFPRLTLHNSLAEGASCRADPAFLRENLPVPESPLSVVLLPPWSSSNEANQVDRDALTRGAGNGNLARAGRIRPT